MLVWCVCTVSTDGIKGVGVGVAAAEPMGVIKDAAGDDPVRRGGGTGAGVNLDHGGARRAGAGAVAALLGGAERRVLAGRQAWRV